jgi:hypothetical protein
MLSYERQIQSLGIVFLLVLAASTEAYAGASPSQWVIVVNGDSARSRTIANHYTHWRNIPSMNVITLNDVPKGNAVSMHDFRDRILKPILQEIQRRNLFPHIQGIAYSSDFPTTVGLADMPRPEGPQAAALTDGASLTGLTYLYRLVVTGDPGYWALGNNFYALRPAEALFGPPLGDPDSEIEIRKKTLREEKDYYRLAELLDQQLKAQPHQFPVAYASAQAWSMAGESAKALQRLQEAIEGGWSFSKYTQEDEHLERLREYSRFQTLIRGCEDDPFDWTPALAFDARKLYNQNGVGGMNAKNSVAYLLSFSLALCMERGLTQEEALKQLKTSIDADFTNPKGTFCFMKTGDVRTTSREAGFKIACDRLKALGHEYEIITDEIMPRSKTCAGVMMGIAVFDWRDSQSKLVPGALGDNLTSFGAVMEIEDQTKLTELLRHGAAASSGTVAEPYAIQAKFPHATMHSSYAAGLTAAEAYYSSVTGPYQLLIAGDPMCQPFAKPPRFQLTGVQHGDRINERTSVELKPIDGPQPAKIRHVALLLNGQFKNKVAFPSRINITGQRIPPGAHELRFIATDDTRIETRWETSVWVISGPDENQLRFSGPKSWKASDRKPLIVNVIGTNPKNPIEIRHDLTKVASVERGKNTCEIPVAKLGTGPVRLQAIEYVGMTEVASIPITVMVE